MNNREYANRLTDTEFVKWGRKFFGTDWEEAKVLLTDEEIGKYAIKILNEPHETTGHEDLVNAGWVRVSEGNDIVLESTYEKYDHGSSRTIAIGKGKLSYSTTGGNCFFDEEIDFLRKCADKIRRENGWA